ncbi:acetyl/propionyl/methylcrotonyl-CoA carboxylase subunit alpha [Glaciecola sp. XM2]|uniref:acetyl/propionyl/methylcrotonyl-CoA carboxylase subunit alpha n=1 Tax=Glaciecola sp. XM2 TaxID=1914931 RepID=UPI001BDF5A90|nr:acetyl/propionyl/methylcrotonyl-CoA carboxylase subunit alpha [Glaciecola sp. XM2]MBT1449727.1 acetyl/propionyl/methylcrotonyl-CoA carboxylase subunit alpha [Glaciecola sp. XM2]
MINKILIANRGEIACRVIRTAKKMGIRTVAVYSEADAHSQHVKMADEGVLLGPAPASDSYLKADLILELAKSLNVDAIHPGYGFLSENAEFSKACADNNIAFIGPSPDAISAMGSKSAAKSIMEKAGVPLVPGYHGDNQDPEFLHQQARDMGYPVLLKAAAGGGGKGMRQVWSDDEFHAALNAAKREAQASFGDQHMLIEKYLTEPRHVEIQVFCDNHGNGVYLFERDCSVQRRHQKIIEEAPAPNMPQSIREQMGESALKAAHAISYSGAGTVEFLFDSDGQFYFMEMNTRLQVEHPVTEMITGEDLVAWQIQVANNLPLPKQQHELTLSGHAFEARVYAEDPDNDFLPATGTLHYLNPPTGEDIRVDTGVVQGDEVSIYYDPMIAKLIVHGNDRQQALAKLVSALHDYHIVGVTTNIDYLLRVAQSEPFIQAQLTTDFVDRHNDLLAASNIQTSASHQALIAFIMLQSNQSTPANATAFSDLSGFRVNHPQQTQVSFAIGEQEFNLNAQRVGPNAWSIKIGDEQHVCKGSLNDSSASVQVNMHNIHSRYVFAENELNIFTGSGLIKVTLPIHDFDDDEHAQTAGAIAAPMNGTVVDILVHSGQTVAKGDAIAIVEAMKMEHSLKAPFDATVVECFFKAGDRVDGGATLLELAPLESE